MQKFCRTATKYSNHNGTSNKFLIIFIDIPQTLIRKDNRPMSHPGSPHALLGGASSPFFSGRAYLENLTTAWGAIIHSTSDSHSLSVIINPSLFIDLNHAVKSSAGSATDANVSGIANSRLPTDQPAPVPPIHASTFLRINLFSSSRRMAGSNIPARHREAALMELHFAIGEPHVRKAPLHSSMDMAWAPYTKLNLIWDMFENQTAAREQTWNEELYRIENEHVRLVNNLRARTFFITTQQGLFQVPVSSTSWFLRCHKLFWSSHCGRSSSMTVTRGNFGANTACKDVVDLKTDRVWHITMASWLWSSLWTH